MAQADNIGDNLAYVKANHGEIYAAYEEFGRLLHEQGGPLDDKTRWLVKVGITTATRNQLALNTHIRKALDAGCTPAEIEHAILLTAPSAGFPTMMEALLTFRRATD